MQSSRSLALFGKVLIINSLGLSQILYSISNTNVTKDTITIVDFCQFPLEQEKRAMLKAMRLAWTPRLLKNANSNWNSGLIYSYEGQVAKTFYCAVMKLPTFYQDMLSFFDDLKARYDYNLGQIVLFNNRVILIDGKPFFIQACFSKGPRLSR